ncbi:interleukin-23 receptor isoform X2 [Mastacembelus armatus]|uniref:interleukin-23 receptor isoform X2 n=1 Tax=Mastacembelus armatus TaxID=205130 RepID=UPI000E465C87|nr:interleukin-12 receptor subunit beta-2-like isoform X2 [Mastacembelus armatus]
MNLSSTIWRWVTVLLSFHIKHCPLLPAGSQRFNGPGYLRVEPAPVFLMGSNLTVYCHVTKCQQSFKISLEHDGKSVAAWKKVNCTTVIFNLVNVQTPRSIVLCKLKSDQSSQIVSGMDLHAGFLPDKPANIICETTRSSDFIDCSWKRGQETHLPKTYNISVSREQGTQIYLHQTQDAEEITIPRRIFDENTKYNLIITAYNRFGTSHSDPFILCIKDIVIPETPHIMQIEFGNSSTAAMLQWKTTESLVHLRPSIRLCTDNGCWEVKEGTVLGEGVIRVDNLRPLTEYKFQMRACNSSSGLIYANITPRLTSSERLLCSKWSQSVRGRSPGKGPSQQLQVWRVFGNHGTNGLRIVTVLWKPPSPDDYSGEVQQYKIFLANGRKQHVACAAALSQYSVQVPAAVQALSVSVVTSYGTSPPANVPLRHSGGFGPVLKELAPAVNDDTVCVSWSWPGTKHWSPPHGELLHYVIQWTSVPVAKLQWKKLAKDANSTSVSGLTAGVRYNVSLYAVTTRGVSAPSSDLVYLKEQKPVSGPYMKVLVHEAQQILIQWDELPVDKQKGFITNYTIYVQTLDSSNTELSVTVSSSSPRQMRLDCPEGALVLQLTASNSAGEGPRASKVLSQPTAPAVGLVTEIVLIITIFIAVIGNLMCWGCVRKRIKQKCVSWGPAWIVENLPKPGNSNAIRLLEDGRELSFSSTLSDPPLSPISLLSWEERDDAYPTIHVKVSHTESGPPTANTALLTSDSGTMLVDCQLEHVSYKPQIAKVVSQREEVEETAEEQKDISASVEEDRCSSVSGELLGGLLSSVEVDFSDSPVGLTLRSVSGLLWPKSPPVFNKVSVGRRGTENDVTVDFASLELKQCKTTSPGLADNCSSQCTGDTMMTAGYFPQVAEVRSIRLCHTPR